MKDCQIHISQSEPALLRVYGFNLRLSRVLSPSSSTSLWANSYLGRNWDWSSLPYRIRWVLIIVISEESVFLSICLSSHLTVLWSIQTLHPGLNPTLKINQKAPMFEPLPKRLREMNHLEQLLIDCGFFPGRHRQQDGRRSEAWQLGWA